MVNVSIAEETVSTEALILSIVCRLQFPCEERLQLLRTQVKLQCVASPTAGKVRGERHRYDNVPPTVREYYPQWERSREKYLETKASGVELYHAEEMQLLIILSPVQPKHTEKR